jgi:arsenate reductase-like glutaredoxin family protein
MEVQIFGTRKSADTRKALRFFSDRRVRTHFVDLAERAPALGELKRWVQKHGLDALIDRESPRYAALGLRHARYGDERWLQLLADEPLLLRQPLARAIGEGSGARLTIGLAEAEWKSWVAAAAAR